VLDSLAEELMHAGNANEAIANYRRSLELNPANANAIQMIRKLEGE
jgi:cytochrome c-type biogenesis protein CcmH/NrfG